MDDIKKNRLEITKKILRGVKNLLENYNEGQNFYKIPIIKSKIEISLSILEGEKDNFLKNLNE